MVDASCIKIKLGGTRGGGDLEDNGMTLHHTMTSKRITNNKLSSTKSPTLIPPGLWDIFMAYKL